MNRLAVPYVVLTLCTSGCVAGRIGVPGSPAEEASATRDTAIIAAVLRTIVTEAGNLRIDPRPLGADPETVHPLEEPVGTGPASVVTARAALIQRIGATVSDAVEDFPCMSFGGNPATPYSPGQPRPPVNESLARQREACSTKGKFYGLIFGLPRVGGPHYPRGRIDRRAEGVDRGWRTIRTVRFTPGAFTTWDVVVAPRAGGGWEVVEMVVLDGVVS